MIKKTLNRILLFSLVFFLIACKKEEEKLEITSIAITSSDVLNLCEAEFEMGFKTFINLEDVEYEWFLSSQLVSNEKEPKLVIKGRGDHSLKVLVSNSSGDQVNAQRMVNFANTVGCVNFRFKLYDQYDHEITEINPPLTNENIKITAKIELPTYKGFEEETYELVWWELVAPDGNVQRTHAEFTNYFSPAIVNYPTSGLASAYLYFCEDRYVVSPDIFEFELKDDIAISNAKVRLLKLLSTEESNPVDAKILIYVDNQLKLETIDKVFDPNANSETFWLTQTDLIQGDENGIIDEINSRDTEFRVILMVDGAEVINELIPTDYLGSFNTNLDRWLNVTLGSEDSYQVEVIFDEFF